MCEVVADLHSFVCGCPVVLAPVDEKTRFYPLNCLGILVKLLMLLTVYFVSAFIFIVPILLVTLGFVFSFLFIYFFCCKNVGLSVHISSIYTLLKKNAKSCMKHKNCKLYIIKAELLVSSKTFFEV